VKVHSANVRGSDEFSVHIVRDGQDPQVVAIYYKEDRAGNRERAVASAQRIAADLKCEYVKSHHLSGREYDKLLPFLDKSTTIWRGEHRV
jgi:hypothetical protein